MQERQSELVERLPCALTRTRHLFRFELGNTMTLVDLPGYGHAAKTPKEARLGTVALSILAAASCIMAAKHSCVKRSCNSDCHEG